MASELANKWAILFGCKDYEHDEDLAPLDYPIHDVEELGQALHEHLEFPEDHLLTFGDGLQYPPELAKFWDKLGEFLKHHSIGAEDLLFFYFTGHGFRQDRDYLLPQNASLNNLEKTGIAVEDVVKELTKKTLCKNIVLFLDACRNPIRGAKGQKGGKGIGEQTSDFLEEQEALCFFSCQPEEQSWEIEKVKHGSFTWFLLEAIRKRECTTAAELDAYLLEKVPPFNVFHGKDPQKPYSKIVPTEKGKLPILASKTKAQIETSEYDAIIEKLLVLHQGGGLLEDKYTEALELLMIVRDKERGLQPDEAFRWEWVKKLCGGRVKLKIFLATWEVSKRCGLGRAGAGSVT